MSIDDCEYGIATDRTRHTTSSGEAVPAAIAATGSNKKIKQYETDETVN